MYTYQLIEDKGWVWVFFNGVHHKVVSAESIEEARELIENE